MKKVYLLLLFLIVLFVDAKPLPKKISSQKKPYIPEDHPKEYYERLLKEGMEKENLTHGHPSYPFYEKMDYKADKKRRREIIQNYIQSKKLRKLSAEEQTLEKLGFIGLVQNGDSSPQNRAVKFVVNNIKKDDSRFILYPYPFKYTDKNGETPEQKTVNEGGFFTLNQSALNGQNFNYIQNISTVNIGKAKGIYDIDIGILSLVYLINGIEQDVFREASTFCGYFKDTIGKTSNCLDGKQAYLDFKQQSPSRGAVVRLSPADILNNTLYDKDSEQLKFKLLIIPDYVIGNEETILARSNFNSDAVEIIRKFRDLGGNIITSGKSGYLLELMGIIEDGVFDHETMLYSSASKGENKIYGCQELFKESPTEQSDFLKQLICLGYKNRTVLSNALVVKKVPEHFDSLIHYTNTEKKIYTKKDGNQVDDKNESSTYNYIMVSNNDEENKGKGHIFIVNGNPIENSWYFENVRNMILYCMTRDIIFDLKIKFNPVEESTNDGFDEDLPIPAGEEGVQLLASYQFYNLFDTTLKNFKLEILFAKKLEIKNLDKLKESGCDLKEEKLQKYENSNLADFVIEKYLLCVADSVDKLTSIKNDILIEITDYTVTQKLIDIPLMHSSLSYSVTENGEEQTIEITPGIFYAQAAIAALLRGTINKDPTSAYPMEGKGLYFDLVLTVENKENTLAKDVNYISLIPLVTPLVDGEDEGLIARIVPVYEDYYFKHNYYYPWKDWENRGIDYIDYAEVAGKNVCYVDDFDTPTKIAHNMREDTPEVITNKYEPKEGENIILDESAGAEKGISPNTLLRQIYFGDSEKFYETAAPRKSLFIDPTTTAGATAYYGGNIPEDEKDKENENVGRARLGFIRVDTFFYGSSFNQYQLPNGFDEKILISIDKFDQSDTTKAPVDGKLFGEKRSKVYNKGHYDSTKGKFNTLIPNEYTNALRQYPFLKKYDPTNPEELKALQELTTDKLTLSHFMVPNKDERIKRAGNILGFEENSDEKSGKLIQYPSVKFIYGHSIELILAPEITRLGGCAEIILPTEIKFKNENEDPVANDRITTSADNVAFFKSEYFKDTNTIKLHFRRGLMPNENYGLPSKCEVYLEELDSTDNFDITLKIYELKFDFSSKTLETYYPVDSATKTVTAIYKSFFSFPCLYMENTLTRQSVFADEASHDMFEYELVNPFARYGGYFQELTKHTTVFGSAEAHHVNDPGFQGSSGGFSIIHNIGTSSIPFAEFLNHGTLMIPGVISTSRLEWKDVWGRFWAQNLRSVYPDIPPIPPAPLNFIMTTTFELITNTDKPKNQERVIEWQSDESVYIRIQMKMRNTYKLYWEPTLCHGNQRAFIKTKSTDYRNPIFIDDEPTLTADKGDDWDVNLGFTSSYGICYNTESYANGTHLDANKVELIKEMTTCSASLDPIRMTECSRKATEAGLPIIKRRPEAINDTMDNTPKKNWNYSPLVEAYLPDGYINSNKLWQLTEDDHYDDPFYKGYPFHLDDCIPNFDNSIIKPHDIIAFPIYKGLGYNVTYSREYSIYKFRQYKGWWSDQLQNKDHTLLAGQQKVSQTSVGHESLLKDEDWIDGYKLKQNPETQNVIKNRLTNLYVCMFNRHRVKVTPGQSKYAFLKNVYQNNVIPILPDLAENDERYTDYHCDGTSQYDIYNISQVDNRVYTGNDRDWLYFAAGLRSNAMEDINVILRLDPLDGTKFEGITKIQDGGRFTYWQPPDGPNSYQYYDGNVNTVISKRVDLTILGELIPNNINTFNTYLYELFSIKDEKEKNREYTMTTYMNSHGYGDATTTVYVGGIDATSCRVNPGEMTYVKIVFYNNAGFDWVMKTGAITLNDTAYKVFLNARSISDNKVHAVQYPSEYKFMTYEIPEEIKPYVTLTPSQHVMDVSPQFFDLTFNNILTIKDALEGDYFYCLNVTDNFPDHLKGKLWEIKMTLHEEWFTALPPDINDPTGIHDYHITIPSIRFGVPDSNGKLYYNLGQAKEMVYTFRLYKEFEIKGIKLINETIADDFKQISTQNDEDKTEVLYNLYESYPSDEEIVSKIKYSKVPDADTFYNLYTFNLTEAFPLFPFEVKPSLPYQSELYLLVQSYSPHSPYGYRNLMTSTKINYNDGRKVKKASASPSYINIYSRGPHLSPEFSHKIVELNNSLEFEVIKDTKIYNGDELTIKLILKAVNEGSKPAYNAHLNLKVDENAEYIDLERTTDAITITEGGIVDGNKLINVFYKGTIINGDSVNIDLHFKVQFGEKEDQVSINRIRNLQEKNKASLVKEIDMSLCLTDELCQEGSLNYGKQISDKTYSIDYYKNIVREIGSISLKVKNIGTETNPIYNLTAIVGDIDSSYKSKTIFYVFYKKIESQDVDYIRIANITEPYYIDQPNLTDAKNYKISYKVIGYFNDGRTLDSSVKENYYEDSKKEGAKKDKDFPAYAIALICIFGLAAIAGGAFMVYKFLIKKGVEATAITAENPTTIKNFGGQFEKVAPNSPRGKKRRIQNRSTVINVENNAPEINK